MKKLIGLPILALILCSCSFKPLTDKFNEVTAPDYVNSSKAEKQKVLSQKIAQKSSKIDEK